ncbi:MAG: HD domain-containing protein [Deltaproteobacteria bacterium]|nr:HD domain-containing protein [Deltaproteobacteria bacterium]
METAQSTREFAQRINDISPAVEGWLQVNMGVFQNESFAPCDLYRVVKPKNLSIKTQRRFVLFAQEGFPFGNDIQKRLFDYGITSLFIRERDSDLYFSYVKEVTNNILRNKNSTSPEKAAAVYTCCREIMKKVYDEPRSVSLKVAKGLIEPTIDLILADSATTHSLLKLAAFDNDTYTHCTNVGIFAVALAKAYFGINSESELRRLGPGFFLHDIGKCEIPLEIINKPGPLSPDERKVVQKHPASSIRILKEMGIQDEETLLIASQHHERDDGKGYSSGLSRSEIHPYARICRIADIYEALTSNRPYHRRRSSFDALKFMHEELITDIDQGLFATFVKIFAPSPREG